MRRLKAATECSGSSSALKAVTTVSRPRGFCGTTVRVGLGASDGAAGDARPARARSLFVFFSGHDRADTRPGSGGSDFLAAEALLGDFVGLVLDLVVVAAALVFFALAGLGRGAFGALDRGALLADLGVLFRDLALFGLAQAGVAERVRAAVTLFVGQCVQHDAGRLGRRCGRRGRSGAAAAAGRAAPGASARQALAREPARLRPCVVAGLPGAPRLRTFSTTTTWSGHG